MKERKEKERGKQLRLDFCQKVEHDEPPKRRKRIDYVRAGTDG